MKMAGGALFIPIEGGVEGTHTGTYIHWFAGKATWALRWREAWQRPLSEDAPTECTARRRPEAE